MIGTEAINITSMEYKGEGNTLEDYEITTFLNNQENKLVRQKANGKLVNIIKQNFNEYNLHFRYYRKWRYLE